MNPNLNVIIGGRSTGKSTLLKSIALVTNPNNTELDSLECDFVKEHLDNVEVLWADGANTPRDIDFFRQNYMHEIAKDKEQTDNLILRILKINPFTLFGKIIKYSVQIIKLKYNL